MKILCIGYYDKFSRFFDYLRKDFQKKETVSEFKIFNMYLSGTLYEWLRFRKSNWISFDAWMLSRKRLKTYKQSLKESNHYKDFDLEQIISMNINTKHHNPKDLFYQTMGYIDILENQLENIDLLLMIGDSRLPFEIAKQLAKKKSIPIYYFEQGPFSSTFIDTKGVNANASIRYYTPNGTFDEAKQQKISPFLNRTKNKKYNRSPIYRSLDYLLELIFSRTFIFPPDLRIDNPLLINRTKIVKFKKFNQNSLVNNNIFLLVCQVPYDVNMTHHSPFYKNHYDILKDVHQNLPENSILVIREHPIYKGKYEEKFYKYIVNNSNIYIDTNKKLDPILNISNAVIVNNSTVGLEAISKFKSVLVLADAYYDESGICLKLRNTSELRSLLQELLTFCPDKNKIIDFLDYFITEQVVEGYVTDRNSTVFSSISNRISNHLKN